MTEKPDVLYEVAAGVATITIDRPEVHNAFREKTMHELITAFDNADASEDVGVIILTGAGDKAFTTGGDVDMENAFDGKKGRIMARLLIRLSDAISSVGKPTIAKVRGWCVGGGNELNLLCDLCIASDTAKFRHTDSRLGSSPIWYATQLLPRIVGLRRAKEIIMLGETFTAEEAARLGWVNKVVPDAELDAATAAWCTTLLGHSPQALRLSKISLNAEVDQALYSVRAGFESITHMYETPEFHEGTAAFLERRAPRFRR